MAKIVKQTSLIVFSVVCLAASAVPGRCYAVEGELVIERTMEKTNGSVARVDGSSIVVMYNQTANAEYEIMLPFDEKLKLDGYRSKADIQAGDIVDMDYEKTVEMPGEEGERRTMKVKKIRFIKRPSQNTALTSEEKTA